MSESTRSGSKELQANPSRGIEYRIAKIAFDGCCRVGKGEQLSKLHGFFTSRGVPAMVLKGDGTRLGAGEAWHDLGSRHWTYRHDYHSGLHTPRTEWDKDAYTLARENKVWVETLGKISVISASRFAAAIFDRSILSRATLAMQRDNIPEGNRLTEEQMWPSHIQIPGEEITYAETMPDILFNMSAPQDVLESRINQEDYDRAFRMRAVYEYYQDFLSAKDALPETTTTRIIDLDGNAPIEENANIVVDHLAEYYPEVDQLRTVPQMYAKYSE